MKNSFLAVLVILFSAGANAQTTKHKVGFTSGAGIQHYNGNLGNSFFKMKTVCFATEVLTLGYYLDKSFDFNISASIGDYGYCQTDEQANKPLPISQRCPGCKDRTGMGELRARMVSGNIALKYKFTNDVILKENARLSPYIYFGMGIVHLADRMQRQCVNEGDHFSLNLGGGLKYNINDRFNVGYNLGIGRFTKENVYATVGEADQMSIQGKKDMYMQNTLFLGVNLF